MFGIKNKYNNKVITPIKKEDILETDNNPEFLESLYNWQESNNAVLNQDEKKIKKKMFSV